MTGSTGTWRGATHLTGEWMVCADQTPASCSVTHPGESALVPEPGLLGRLLRHRVQATGTGGSTSAASAPSTPVVIVPARPARPVVEARSGGARVTLPAPPLGTTHWRLVLDGRPLQLVPVGTPVYWLTGLVNGTSHTLALSAVAVTGDTQLESAPTAGSFTAMAQQYDPYLTVTGPAVLVTLPRAPAGAAAWLLTVGGATTTIPITATTTTVAVPTGSPVTWSLTAAAGAWDGVPFGGLTVPSNGAVTPLATPTAPTVTPGSGSLTFTFPAPPPGTTAWRVSVGATTRPDVPVGTPSLTVTGLYPGYPSTWTLRAVNGTARSVALTGTAAAR